MWTGHDNVEKNGRREYQEGAKKQFVHAIGKGVDDVGTGSVAAQVCRGKDASDGGLPGGDLSIAFGLFANEGVASHVCLIPGAHVNQGIFVGLVVVTGMNQCLVKQEDAATYKEE